MDYLDPEVGPGRGSAKLADCPRPAPCTKSSISSHYTRCISSFTHLYHLVEASSPPRSNLLPNVAEDLGRFRVWAGNIGAHRTGRVSLDYRLREASQMHAQVTKLLTDLSTDLEKAIYMLEADEQLQDRGQQWEISFEDDPEFMEELGLTGDGGGETLEPEIEAFMTLLSDITHIITCLYRFSMATRSAAPRDRLHKITSIEVTHFEYWDIAHIKHKFPTAPSYLIERLGKANTRRRQLMKYYREHHDTIARYIDLPLASDGRTVEHKGALKSSLGKQAQAGAERESGSITNAPTILSMDAKSQTTMSTIKQGAFNIHDVVSVERDEDQLSQTSYATSANHQRARIAPPPNPDAAYNGTRFECPYFFQIISIQGRHAWRKHVFRDLQPYTCTYEDCPRPEKLYSSLHDWYGHELQAHRREWYCNACAKSMSSRAQFEEHVKQIHPEIDAPLKIKILTDQCERAKTSDQACLLCGCALAFSEIRKHLGGHLQGIALFALPYFMNETDERRSERGQSSEETPSDSLHRNRRSLGSSVLEFDSNPDYDPVSHQSGAGLLQEESHSVYGPSISSVDVLPHMHKGADFEAVEEEASHLAVTESNAEIVHLLPEKGANPEAQDPERGLAPLHVAASEGNAITTKLLLEKGVDIENRCAFRGRTALHYAAAGGHTALVELLLTKGTDIELVDEGGDTALNLAAGAGFLEVVRLLLEKGSRVDFPNRKGLTALHLAAVKRHAAAVKLLLERGADIELVDEKGETAFNSAAYNGHLEVLKLLLEKGSRVDLSNKWGLTALHNAAINGHAAAVKLLLERGADFELVDGEGDTAFNLAANHGHLEVLELLLEKGSRVNFPNKWGLTALHNAAINGHAAAVKLLIEWGAEIELVDKKGDTAFNWAAYHGHLEILELLLEKGSRVNFPNKERLTALHHSAVKGHTAAVKLLLEGGADIELVDEKGETAFNSAAYNGHLEVLKLLLEKGSRVDLPNKWGLTALHNAAINGHAAVVKLLIEGGAEIELVDKKGDTAFNWAAYHGRLEILKLFLEKGSRVDSPNKGGLTALHHSAMGGHAAAVKLLLEAGADIQLLDKDGDTVFNSAAYLGHLEVLKLFLEKGPRVDFPNKRGLTALHHATMQGHAEVVKLLLAEGADIELADEDGDTPVHCAVLAAAEGVSELEVVRILLDKGANVDLTNKEGKTALDLAIDLDHTEFIRVVMEKGIAPHWQLLHIARLRGKAAIANFILGQAGVVDFPNRRTGGDI